MSAGHAPTAALLIDADNVSVSAVDFAAERMAREGRLTVRRAYGGLEKLAGMKDCLLRHGIRAQVNQGKGTTDALLVVDAMDLLHGGQLPDVVAIASSDADFAPLALRLREAGRRVICFAHEAKSADAELARCYDELVYVDAAAADAPVRAARKTAARKTPARKAAAPAPAPVAPPADPVRDALSAIPGFDAGRPVELNDAIKRLRDAKLLGRSASGPKFFARHAPYVELTPAAQPTKLRLRDGRA